MYLINKNRTRAITLLELLIALILIFLLIGSIWLVYNAGMKVFYSQWVRSGVKNDTGNAFKNMTRELRQADSVTSAGQHSITFTADINNDGSSETLQYIWSGTSGDPLNRIATSATTPLIRSVKNLAVSYYDANDTLLNIPVTASQVRLVVIDATTSNGTEAFELRTSVRPRNI